MCERLSKSDRQVVFAVQRQKAMLRYTNFVFIVLSSVDNFSQTTSGDILAFERTIFYVGCIRASLNFV